MSEIKGGGGGGGNYKRNFELANNILSNNRNDKPLVLAGISMY